MKVNLTYFLFVFLLITFSLKSQNKEYWINIIVHGSVGLRSNFNFNTFRRLLRDQIEGSTYQKKVLEIRKTSYICRMQPIQQTGLLPISLQLPLINSSRKSLDSLKSKYSVCPNLGSRLFAQLYEKMQKKYINPNAINKYYTFGWCGLVSFKERYKEAYKFYNALKAELKSLLSRGYKPKIRIIAYSHGATVSFNLAAIRQHYFPHDTFKIDEVISVGMPVLNTTRKLISDPMFKKIYHIYSSADSIQILDIFNPHNLTSRRKFYGYLPKKLVQIELNITKPKSPRVYSDLDLNLKKKKCPVNQAPGHIELWFFGWVPNSYRTNLSYYPLPTSVFIPYLIYINRTYAPFSNDIQINIFPNSSFSILRKKECSCKTRVPFMNIQEFNQLQSFANQFCPNPINNNKKSKKKKKIKV